MKNLELVTTENFGAVTCDFYRNVGNEIFMTREQIGEALGYSNPSTAIKNIAESENDKRYLEKLKDETVFAKYPFLFQGEE